MISPEHEPVIGAISLGFSTMVQPACNRRRHLADDLVFNGQFQGVISPTTADWPP